MKDKERQHVLIDSLTEQINVKIKEIEILSQEIKRIMDKED